MNLMGSHRQARSAQTHVENNLKYCFVVAREHSNKNESTHWDQMWNTWSQLRSSVSRIRVKVVMKTGWCNELIKKADDAAYTLSVARLMTVKRIIVRNQHCESHENKALHFCWCPMYHTRSPPPEDAACRRSSHKSRHFHTMLSWLCRNRECRCSDQHSKRPASTINNNVAKPGLRNKRLLGFHWQYPNRHWNTLYNDLKSKTNVQEKNEAR